MRTEPTPEDKEAAMSEAVEVMARERCRHNPVATSSDTRHWSCRCGEWSGDAYAWDHHVNESVARALLEPRATRCETCGGTGNDDRLEVACRAPGCGTGQVTRPSLAVLRGEA